MRQTKCEPTGMLLFRWMSFSREHRRFGETQFIAPQGAYVTVHKRDRRCGNAATSFMAIVGIVVAIAAAACGGNATSVVSPSGTAPVSLHADPGGDKFFTMTIAPTSVPVNSSNVVLTVTVTNCDTGITGCTTPSSSTQKIGSAEIVIPVGFTVTAVGTPTGDQPGWGTSWTTGNTVVVGATGAGAGTHKLAPGEHETFTITVTTPIVCDTFGIDTIGASDSTLPATFGTDWHFSGDALSLTTTGCSTGECPAAPAITTHYLHDHGVKSNESLFNTIVNAVAQKMADGDFGRDPCAAGYADAVIAFINTLHQF